jgi:hypothetical protein
MHLILSSANELVSCDWKLIVNFFVVALRSAMNAEQNIAVTKGPDMSWYNIRGLQ